MKNILLLLLIFSFSLSTNSFSGDRTTVTTDTGTMQLYSYYDLRNRESFTQVTNISENPIAIHVQIFQNDIAGCPELNFYDELTPNDTHIYDMRNLAGNSSPVNISLNDDSNGIVVITHVEGVNQDAVSETTASLIGNFRIVDIPGGFEYRTNTAGFFDETSGGALRVPARFTFNFNQIGGNNLADIVGFEIEEVGANRVKTEIEDLDTIAFVYNDAETPTSCDNFVFACGGVVTDDDDNFPTDDPTPPVGEGDFLNVGINDLFPSTNGEITICPGNNSSSGFVELLSDEENINDEAIIVGYAGLNNGNGTGSMDSWFANPNGNICELLGNSDFGQCNDFFDDIE